MTWLKAFLKRLILPLRSRKVRVAIAVGIVAYAAKLGLDISETLVVGILGLGAALIGGIALEDAGEKSANGKRIPPEKDV